ncbi:MAG: O-antigen ligase family protein [Oscillospiraceae bacterium]|nr:O-antigen ligase family protein [Oscillospiraceae bacterium]
MEQHKPIPQWLARARGVWMSSGILAAQFALAALVIVLHAEIVGIALFLCIICVTFALCDDVLAFLAPSLFASLFLLKLHDSYSFFRPLWWITLPLFASLIFHFVYYRRPFRIKKAKAFWPMLAVSAAATLGGAGAISREEYFAPGALYHVFFLGFGMLLLYCLFHSRIEIRDKDAFLKAFTRGMIAVGLLACFMIFHHYLEHLPRVIETKSTLAFQWRNNVSSILMLVLPFPFYRALKQPAFLLAGAAMYAGLLLSGSRGGLLFGSVELLFCLTLLLFADKRHRVIYLAVGGLLAVALVMLSRDLYTFLRPTLERLRSAVTDGLDEARGGLYVRAVLDFLRHPIAGTGLGYMGNRDKHPSKDFALCWYHCGPLQVLGSMGLMGALAYGWQFIARLRLLLPKQRELFHLFHLTLFIAFLGIEMMSLVNPGVFAPIPYLFMVMIFTVIAEKLTAAPALTPSSS